MLPGLSRMRVREAEKARLWRDWENQTLAVQAQTLAAQHQMQAAPGQSQGVQYQWLAALAQRQEVPEQEASLGPWQAQALAGSLDQLLLKYAFGIPPTVKYTGCSAKKIHLDECKTCFILVQMAHVRQRRGRRCPVNCYDDSHG